MEERDQHSPRWVPYSPPPADVGDRLRRFVRRFSFPVAVLLIVLGVAGTLYWSAQTTEEGNSSPSVVMSADPRSSSGREGKQKRERTELTIHSHPTGASVWINGDSVGTTPLRGHSLAHGTYLLSLRAPDYYDVDTVAVVTGVTDSLLRFSLRPRPGVPASSGQTPTSQEAEEQQEPVPQTPRPPAEAESSTASPEQADVPQATTGILVVTSSPSEAVVRIDGEERGRTPLTVDSISTGEHEVVVQLDGHKLWTARTEVEAGGARRLHAPLPPLTGRLRVLARPWGTIYVDGTLHARDSDVWYDISLPVGRHEVTVIHPVLGEQTRQVSVQADQETSVIVDLRPGSDS